MVRRSRFLLHEHRPPLCTTVPYSCAPQSVQLPCVMLQLTSTSSICLCKTAFGLHIVQVDFGILLWPCYHQLSCSVMPLHVSGLSLVAFDMQALLPSHPLLARSSQHHWPRLPPLMVPQQQPRPSRHLPRHRPRRQFLLGVHKLLLLKGPQQRAKAARARRVMLRRHPRLQGPRMPTCSSWLTRGML